MIGNNSTTKNVSENTGHLQTNELKLIETIEKFLDPKLLNEKSPMSFANNIIPFSKSNKKYESCEMYLLKKFNTDFYKLSILSNCNEENKIYSPFPKYMKDIFDNKEALEFLTQSLLKQILNMILINTVEEKYRKQEPSLVNKNIFNGLLSIEEVIEYYNGTLSPQQKEEIHTNIISTFKKYKFQILVGNIIKILESYEKILEDANNEVTKLNKTREEEGELPLFREKMIYDHDVAEEDLYKGGITSCVNHFSYKLFRSFSVKPLYWRYGLQIAIRNTLGNDTDQEERIKFIIKINAIMEQYIYRYQCQSGCIKLLFVPTDEEYQMYLNEKENKTDENPQTTKEFCEENELQHEFEIISISDLNPKKEAPKTLNVQARNQ